MKKSILLVIVMLAFGISSYAQNLSATATATATVLEPLNITADVDLNFGSFAASAVGTVTVDNAGTRSETGGIALVGGTVAAASFTITGAPTAVVALTLPTLPLTLDDGLGNTMDITTLDPSIATATTTLPVGGSVTLDIGGTLDVAAGQTAGVYTNTTDFIVTVNYN